LEGWALAEDRLYLLGVAGTDFDGSGDAKLLLRPSVRSTLGDKSTRSGSAPAALRARLATIERGLLEQAITRV
jgi:hypothetical protein